jgi:cysteine desulfurase
VIYLDYHAAAPVCPEARAAMREAADDAWANPSSVHAAGRASKGRLEHARRSVARAIGAEPADVVLTSGGTEAVNLGLHGLYARGSGLVTTVIEHPAVAATMRSLASSAGGAPPTLLEVSHGIPPSPDEVAASVTPGALVAIQWVNHETGTLLPVAAYANAIRARGGLLFVDGTQALGKVPVDVATLGADAVAFASHKMGGPAGAGGLWVARGRELGPLLRGGGQERGRRPGTPDVISAAGFGAACAVVHRRLAAMDSVGARRDRLEAKAKDLGAMVQGDEAARVATACHVSFPGWRGPFLVAALDVEGLCVASGAACSSGLAEPSSGLMSMYSDAPHRADGVRMSLGPETTDDELERAANILENVIGRVAPRGS